MQTVNLPNGRETTLLGFGCSSIMGGMGRNESLQTLEWAFEAGVRHFDVAPMYGFGAAEACVGDFLARHAGEVTVATKFGIPPARSGGVLNLARAAARPLLKALPTLKARAQRAANVVAAAPAVRNLSAAEAEKSLVNSLRQLRVEHLDLFLLHDATLEEVQNSNLIDVLEKAKADGRIGSYGVGTDRSHAAAILRAAPQYAAVVQQEWSVFDPVAQGGAFHIHHRSLSHNLRRLQAHLADASTAARWSDTVGRDLQDTGTLSELMMRAALASNPSGIVLFSSKNREHIRANATLCEPGTADAQAGALHRLVQEEANSIPEERPA